MGERESRSNLLNRVCGNVLPFDKCLISYSFDLSSFSPSSMCELSTKYFCINHTISMSTVLSNAIGQECRYGNSWSQSASTRERSALWVQVHMLGLSFSPFWSLLEAAVFPSSLTVVAAHRHTHSRPPSFSPPAFLLSSPSPVSPSIRSPRLSFT